MNSKWARRATVPVVIVLVSIAALWTSGCQHQGRTVSQAITVERKKAATTADFGPLVARGRRYKVEAVSFHAIDESGPDWWGSDEIYAEWKDSKSGFTAITSIHEGVNTGDTVMIGPRQRCILPLKGESKSVWDCAEGGVPGPFEFEVALFEADRGGFQFCPQHSGIIAADCIYDDLIDQKTVSFTTAELEAAMPHVGNTFQETIAIRTFCGVPESKAVLDTYGCVATGPDYRFTYQLTRLPDADLHLHP